jgi:lambda family phage tail tape measure protein
MADTTTRIYELQVKLAQESLANLKKLQGSTAAIESQFASLTGVVKNFGTGLVSAFSVGAVVAAVNQAVAAVDDLAAAAQRVGMGVESFSALAFAAEQSDMAVADLEIGLKELQKSMVEVGTKGAGVLDALGIDKTKPQVEVLKDFAEAFKTIHDPALRTNALLEVFGKSGLKLRPLLEQGAGGIDALMKKAKELGIVISEDVAKSFSDLDNQMKASQRVAQGLTRDMTAGLAPALSDVLEGFQMSAKGADTFKTLGEGLGVILRGVAAAATVVASTFKAIGTIMGGVSAASVLLVTGNFKEAGAAIREMDADLDAQADALGESLKRITGLSTATDGATAATEANTDATKKNDAAVRAALQGQEAAKKANEKRISDVLALNKALEDQIFRLAQVGQEDTEHAKALRALDAIRERLTVHEREAFDLMVARIGVMETNNKATKDAADALKELDGMLKASRTDGEKLDEELRRLAELLAQFPEREDEIRQATERRWKAYVDGLNKAVKATTDQEKLLAALGDKIDGYAKQISGTFVDFITHADDAKFAFGDFAESVLRDIVKMITQLMIMEPILAAIKSGLGIGAVPAAHGMAFAHGGRALPFAEGGVVTRPTTFAFAGGTGLMGEAGPEAIMPLKRNAAGQLGVVGAGGGGDVTVNVINQAGADVDVESQRGPDGKREITVLIQQAVNDGFARGRFDAVMGSTYGVNRRGR